MMIRVNNATILLFVLLTLYLLCSHSILIVKTYAGGSLGILVPEVQVRRFGPYGPLVLKAKIYACDGQGAREMNG